MAGQGLLLAAVLLVLVAQPSEAQLIGRLAARITNRLDASPVAAPNVTTCPVSPASTQLNFTDLVSACPATSALNTTEFCDGCICALTDAYMPALRAAGVFNITKANASATDSSMLAAATAVVRACSATFLAPALAAGVELGGLTRLSTQCNFTAASVPECLRQKLAAMQPTPIPQVTSSDLRSSATAGGGDYIEDNSTALTTDVLRAAAAATPATSTTSAGSNATVGPTSAGNVTTTPADNSTLVSVIPNATTPVTDGTAELPGTIEDPTLTAPLNTTTTDASTTPIATVPAATTATTPAATTPDGSAAAFPDYTPVASPDVAAADTPDASTPAATPATATPPVVAPVVVTTPAVVPDAAPQTVTATSTAPAPVTQSDAPNGATLQQLPVQLIGALLSASLLVLLL